MTHRNSTNLQACSYNLIDFHAFPHMSYTFILVMRIQYFSFLRHLFHVVFKINKCHVLCSLLLTCVSPFHVLLHVSLSCCVLLFLFGFALCCVLVFVVLSSCCSVRVLVFLRFPCCSYRARVVCHVCLCCVMFL